MWSGRSLNCWASAWIFFLAFFKVISRDSRPTPELKAPISNQKISIKELGQPTSEVVAPTTFAISRDKSADGWASSVCVLLELMENMTIVVLRHLKIAGFVWIFNTWTSETMIPDSNTVPQAVQTESALGKELCWIFPVQHASFTVF